MREGGEYSIALELHQQQAASSNVRLVLIEECSRLLQPFSSPGAEGPPRFTWDGRKWKGSFDSFPHFLGFSGQGKYKVNSTHAHTSGIRFFPVMENQRTLPPPLVSAVLASPPPGPRAAVVPTLPR